MKIAILLCGHFRTWDECKDNFLKTFTGHDVTLFGHTYDKKYGYHPYIVQKLGLSNKIDEHVFLLDPLLFEMVNIEKELTEDDVPDLDEYPVNLDIYSQIRKVRLCNEMRELWCKNNDTHHDLIIKTRFDVLYSSNFSLPEILKDNSIYIPVCPETLYPSDVCYMGNSNSMKKLIDSLSRKYPQKIINPHTWLNMCMEGINHIQLESTVIVKRYSQ